MAEALSQPPILQVADLHVYYGHAHVLQGVDFTLDHGVLAIVGRNGMGKSTLCHTIMGMLPAQRGSIKSHAVELLHRTSHQVVAQGIGYVPQGRRVWPSLTVDEHFRVALRKSSTTGNVWTIEQIYQTFPRLAERRRHGGAQLSGGEQQMLAIGRALLSNPKLLIMDEPSEGLAPVIVEQVALMLKQLAERRPSPADIGPLEVARHHPKGLQAVFTGDRGSAVAAMAQAFERFIISRRDLAGIVSAGGSGGTALATPAMRALPVGIPKVMVSTVASGDVKSYVGPSDICMMYSVTDVSGINRISERILANAANALVGMIAHTSISRERTESKPAIGLTMFGVTTPCVQAVAKSLEDRFDCLVFHTTGTGGQSMEKLVDSGLLSGVIDVTTTEVADLLMGGVFSAGEGRLDAIIRSRIPYVGSCGALDMVNWGPIDTVPARFQQRNLYRHNPQVTLMRTTADESAEMGRWIADKLNRCDGPVRFLIPEGGVSLIDAPGQAFYDPDADRALFDAISRTFQQTRQRRLIRLPYNINDPLFSAALVEHFLDVIEPTLAKPLR